MNTSSEYFDINLLNLIKRFWSLKFYFISFWIITVVITLAVNPGKINNKSYEFTLNFLQTKDKSNYTNLNLFLTDLGFENINNQLIFNETLNIMGDTLFKAEALKKTQFNKNNYIDELFVNEASKVYIYEPIINDESAELNNRPINPYYQIVYEYSDINYPNSNIDVPYFIDNLLITAQALAIKKIRLRTKMMFDNFNQINKFKLEDIKVETQNRLLDSKIIIEKQIIILKERIDNKNELNSLDEGLNFAKEKKKKKVDNIELSINTGQIDEIFDDTYTGLDLKKQNLQKRLEVINSGNIREIRKVVDIEDLFIRERNITQDKRIERATKNMSDNLNEKKQIIRYSISRSKTKRLDTTFIINKLAINLLLITIVLSILTFFNFIKKELDL